MNRRLGAWISLAACVHLTVLGTGLATPALAQSKGNKPQAAQPAKPALPQDLVAKGQVLFDDQQYEESIQALSAALLRPSNTKEQKVEIYRLLALNYITLGRKDEAESAVRGLLVIEPDYQMPASESPRFRDFFAQTRKKWEAEGRPGLVKEEPVQKPVALKHGSPTEATSGQNIDLRAHLDDPDGRTGSVKLYFRTGTKGDFTEKLADVEGDSVHAQIPGSAVKPPVIDYYFEVADGAGSILASRGDATGPLRIAVPEPSKGWVLPVVIGGGVVGAAAVVGILALAGVFKSSSNAANGRGTSTVSVSVGEASR